MVMNGIWVLNPPPLEEVDPELGELIRLFVNGQLKPVPVVGRNEPCPCGASKNGKRIKFKKCTCNQFHPK